MIGVFWLVVSLVGLVLVMGGCFLAVMNAKRMRKAGTLTPFWTVIAVFWGAVGTVLDVVWQWSLGHMFAEAPPFKRHELDWLGRTWRFPFPEMLFSDRVQRHVDDSTGWRLRLALYWGRQLNGPDPGVHIRRMDKARDRLAYP